MKPTAAKLFTKRLTVKSVDLNTICILLCATFLYDKPSLRKTVLTFYLTFVLTLYLTETNKN
jgi:hypothetical protein